MLSPNKETARGARAKRALQRQRAYQRVKVLHVAGREHEIIAAMRTRSAQVRAMLERFGPVANDARVLEVGSGAHGLVFYFGTTQRVGVDPLACDYAALFPAWQASARTIAAYGEQLPFANGSFNVVLCDNVVDHAEAPADIVREIARVLAPAGLLYFTVNFHHPIYSVAARLHDTWNAAGLHYEIGPFADHTVHLTLESAQRLFDDLPLRVLSEHYDVEQAKTLARARQARHPGDLLKRVFFKNALYEVVAERA
jgi:SAM-dependent methyltransferase